MSNDLVVMSNAITKAAYNLSVNEQRLILSAISQIPKGEPVNSKEAYFITREDFVHLGSNPNVAARDIRTATKDLMKKTLFIETNEGITEFHWLSEVLRYDKNAEKKLKAKYPNPEDYAAYMRGLKAYNLLDSLPTHRDNDDIVARIVFNDRILLFLSDLKANFTQFLLEDVAGFSSIYSFRIYQMMMQFKSTGFCKISLNDLRYALALGDKYPLTADLKRWVIDTATDEINKESHYIVKYKMIKTGRKFTHLELKFQMKKDEKIVAAEVAKRNDDNGDLFTVEGLSDKQLGRIARNKQFVADYNHLVSSTSPAGQDPNAWEFEMTNRLKKDASQFKKRPIREYLEY